MLLSKVENDFNFYFGYLLHYFNYSIWTCPLHLICWSEDTIVEVELPFDSYNFAYYPLTSMPTNQNKDTKTNPPKEVTLTRETGLVERWIKKSSFHWLHLCCLIVLGYHPTSLHLAQYQDQTRIYKWLYSTPSVSKLLHLKMRVKSQKDYSNRMEGVYDQEMPEIGQRKRSRLYTHRQQSLSLRTVNRPRFFASSKADSTPEVRQYSTKQLFLIVVMFVQYIHK